MKEIDEEMIQQCLQFLRTATACMLLVKATQKHFSAGVSTFDSVSPDDLQCGLDTALMAQIRQQVDDEKEF